MVDDPRKKSCYSDSVDNMWYSGIAASDSVMGEHYMLWRLLGICRGRYGIDLTDISPIKNIEFSCGNRRLWMG